MREALARHRALVLSAAPGAGKTTRVPPALVDAGPVILLQPRRVAARAIAQRIARERGWTLGREVGWHIRFERKFTRDTSLLVVTEGILTARLLQDPLLSEFATVVFDEFHERSIHADVGLALARQAWTARTDLRVVVMSATLDTAPISAFLSGAPIIDVMAAPFPLSVEYAPGETVAGAAAALAARPAGNILCFLPGAREIDSARRDLERAALPDGIEVVTLHGSLDNDAQDDAIRPAAHRRIVLATNIAETSLTVPGVSAVVDGGQVKTARYDPALGIDRLSLERVTQDSADQRAGRAARLGSGVAVRLWDARDRLRPRREPDIARIDLAGPLLDVIGWGADPAGFEWYERPPADRLEAASALLRRLGAIDGQHRITEVGRQMQRLPVHPRLARILLDGHGAPEAAQFCASIAEGASPARRDDMRVRQIAAELGRVVAAIGVTRASRLTDRELRHAVFAGYADRLARRRTESRERYLLSSGHGASLAREAGDVNAEFIVAIDVVAGERDGAAEARIRAASEVDAAWVRPTSSAFEHRYDSAARRVKAVRVERYDAIVLSETPVPATDPVEAARLLARAWRDLPQSAGTVQLLRRLRFAGLDIDLDELAAGAAMSAATVDDIDLERYLPPDAKHMLARDAPGVLTVPSGRQTRLEYGEDGSVSASVKLQELFGLAASPIIGRSRVPVTFHLLAPNGGPVQTTRDLKSFWERTYPEVRKELRRRYPKHPWPDDPWSAQPTHRTVRRS